MTRATPDLAATPSGDDLKRTVVARLDLFPGYELQGSIGKGGFGEVFQARQVHLDRVVALKVVPLSCVADPAAAARFETEALTLGRLHHPNIVPLYDFGRTERQMYLSMERLEGEDLGGLLRRVGRLDERTAWGIARQAAAGLAHAAAAGVVHRDVKPANLFLVAAPTGVELPPGVPMVKVTDFGLALAKWAVDPDPEKRTAPGVMLGTPAYMAPEQQRGEAVDGRADIYALGATVCHALTGRPPFEGTSVWGLMARKLENTPRELPPGSRGSAELIAAMMQADPAKRIASYDVLIRRIDGVLAALASGRPARPRRGWPRRAGRAVVVSLAVAGLGVAASWAWSRVGPAPAPAAAYEPFGDPVPLFRRDSLAGWSSVPGFGGQRGLDTDDEKATVLSLGGHNRVAFPSSEAYRLTLGLSLQGAAAAEVQFAFPFPAKASATAKRLVLRVTQVNRAQLGSRAGDTGAFEPAARAVEFPAPARPEDRRPYVEVRIDRTPRWWAVHFDGQPAGRLPDDDAPKMGEIRVVTEGGPVRVDTVELERLRPAHAE